MGQGCKKLKEPKGFMLVGEVKGRFRFYSQLELELN